MSEPLYRTLFYRHPNSSPAGRKRGVVDTLMRISVATPDRPVVFSFSDSPMTDGKTVWLGSLDPHDEAFEALALGHGIHEMMHVKTSDMTVLPDIAHLTPFLRSLINVLEDIRIDTLGMAESDYYALWREAMAEVLEKRHLLAAQEAESHPPLVQLCLWLHLELTTELPMQWPQRQLPALREIVKAHLPKSLRDELLTLARGARTAPDTQAVVVIAQAIRDRLEEALAARQPRLRHETFESAQATAKNGAYHFDKPFLRRLLTAKKGDLPDLGLAHFLDEGNGDGKAVDSAEKVVPLKRKAKSEVSYTVNNWPDPDAIEDRCALEDAALYTRKFNQSETKCRTIQHAFERAFRFTDDDEDEASVTGFLSAPDIALRARMGSERLFASPAAHDAVRGRLVVLLDRSGSMGVTRMTSAKIAVAALWQALDRESGIRRNIAVFPGLEHAHVGPLVRESDTSNKFLMRFKAVNAYGSTPINEALLWAADELAEGETFAGEANLILVITDGDFPETLGAKLEKKLQASQAEIAVLSIAMKVANTSLPSVTVTNDEKIPEALVELVGKTSFCKRLRAV